jgi:alkaline phosphatase D
MQAWYENMPVRRDAVPHGGRRAHAPPHRLRRPIARPCPRHPRYRSGQICTDKPIDRCLPLTDPSHPGILGADQHAWLEQGLGAGSRWNLLAQQVMVMPFAYPAARGGGRTNTDSWSGYPASRNRLVEAIQARKLTNVVIATGDVHKHHAGVLPARDNAWEGPAAATEFVTSSISSDGDGSALPADWQGVPAENPHCPLIDGRRGYQVFDIGRDLWRTDAKVVDRVTTPGGDALDGRAVRGRSEAAGSSTGVNCAA